jgi:HAD superfamily hydrolase (TIGR01509 family)
VVDAVLWDMDGTLVDSEKLWEIGLYELAEVLGGRLTPQTRARMVGTNVRVTFDLLFADLGRPLTPESYAYADAWLEARMHELFAEDIPWQPGAPEALRMVRETGLPTALVTSTVRSLTEGALDYIGREFFDVTVCGDEVDGMNKPHPEPYRRAARMLGVDPRRCIAVEDSPTGVASADAAGCTVHVVPGEVRVEPGERRVFLTSLADLQV